LRRQKTGVYTGGFIKKGPICAVRIKGFWLNIIRVRFVNGMCWILPGINFSPAGVHPWFRVMVVAGIIPHLVYTAQGYMPESGYEHFSPFVAHTHWLPVSSGLPAFGLGYL
jgi:hypothetical protein